MFDFSSRLKRFNLLFFFPQLQLLISSIIFNKGPARSVSRQYMWIRCKKPCSSSPLCYYIDFQEGGTTVLGDGWYLPICIHNQISLQRLWSLCWVLLLWFERYCQDAHIDNLIVMSLYWQSAELLIWKDNDFNIDQLAVSSLLKLLCYSILRLTLNIITCIRMLPL